MKLSTIAALIVKDLRLFFGDRRALLIQLAAPIALASFAGFIFDGIGSSDASPIKIAVVDQDRSAVSSAIVTQLGGDRSLELAPVSLAEARESVRSGKLAATLVVPAGFGAAAGPALFGGSPRPELTLLHDPSRPAEVGLVQALLMEHVTRAVGEELMQGTEGEHALNEALAHVDRVQGLSWDERTALRRFLGDARSMMRLRPSRGPGVLGMLSLPYEIRAEAVTARDGVPYNVYAHAFSAMGVQFIYLGAIETAVAMLAERRRGLWRRIRAAPVPRHAILLSRILSSTLTTLFVLGALFAAGRILFDVRVEGSVFGFALICLATAVSASAFGLLVAAFGKTPEATRGAAIFFAVVLAMLGGAMIPSFLFPEWLQVASRYVPTHWAFEGLVGATWRGIDLRASARNAAMLVGFAALFTAAAVARFRWSED